MSEKEKSVLNKLKQHIRNKPIVGVCCCPRCHELLKVHLSSREVTVWTEELEALVAQLQKEETTLRKQLWRCKWRKVDET